MGEREAVKMFANPFYCVQVAPIFTEPHEPLVTKEKWVEAGAKCIKEIGAEAYLEALLENLEGNYV